ncbi:MAG: hypothetical protein ACK4UJ_08330 [Leptonema sp. (in: bacteria)]
MYYVNKKGVDWDWQELLFLKEDPEKLQNGNFWKEFFQNIITEKIEESKKAFYSLDKEIEEKIPKIRKKIFEDKEFLQLTKNIISYNPQESSKPKIKRVYKFYDFFSLSTFSKLENMFLQDEMEILIELLFSKRFLEIKNKLESYFKSILYGFPSYCLSIANEYTTCYIPYYCYNLDPEVQKNFFINFNDEVFAIDFLEIMAEDSYEIFKITEEIKNHIFFKKRFSFDVFNTIQYILFVPQRIGSFDFLHSLFFTTKKELDAFLERKRENKVKIFLKEFYMQFTREAHILFETKQKIIKRMVFSYSFYQIKKLLSIYNKLIHVDLAFEGFYEEEITNAIEKIKKSLENTNSIFIRNHFSKISIFIKYSEENLLEVKSFLKNIKDKLSVPFKYRIRECTLQSWTFLDV